MHFSYVGSFNMVAALGAGSNQTYLSTKLLLTAWQNSTNKLDVCLHNNYYLLWKNCDCHTNEI